MPTESRSIAVRDPRIGIHLDRLLADWAAEHYGIVTRRKLEALGATDVEIKRRLGRGSLIRADYGVFYVGHRSGAPGQREAVALAAAGPGAELFGPSAAAWRGMTEAWHGDVHLIVGKTREKNAPGAVRHVADLRDEDRGLWRGMPCVIPERAVMDLPRDRLRQALQWLMREGIMPEPILHRMHGRRGAVAFRDEVEALVPQLAHTLSELEARFVRLCRAYGLPLPEVNQTRAGGDLLDCTWKGSRLVVELDGRRWHAHRDREDQARDRRRVLEGRRTLRYSWADVTRRAPMVADEVSRAIAL